MTREEIHDLIPYISPDSAILYSIGDGWSEYWDLEGRARWIIQVYTSLMQEPDFGWKFCLTFAKKDKPLPDGVERISRRDHRSYLWFQKVNNLMRGKFDWDDPDFDAIAVAMSIISKKNIFARVVIDGLLIIPGLSYELIAKRLNISEDGIRLYEQLFFNVRDRWDEPLYIRRLIYPEHKLVELAPNYLYAEEARNIILRKGARHGVEAFLVECGLEEAKTISTSEDNLRLYETGVMEAAVREYQLGGGHGHYPGSTNARQIAQSIHQSGQQQQNNADRVLETMSITKPVMETLRQIQAPRLAAMRAMLKGESVKTPNVNDTKQNNANKPPANWAEAGYEQNDTAQSSPLG